MHAVGRHLQEVAREKVLGSLEFDIFGRSSFNRYYYASYLEVRKLLSTLDESWREIQHGAVPDLLTGQVLREIRKGRKKYAKFGDRETYVVFQQAISSIHSLSKMMRDAYAIRVTADYYPEVAIEFNLRDGFVLQGITITQARNWFSQVREYANRIKRAWELTNG